MRVRLPGLLLLVAFLTACTPAGRYKVKTFFFTGVPDPNAENVERVAESAQAPLLVPRKRRRQAVTRPSPYFLHGPFGSGQCESCHATTQTSAFRTRMKDTAASKSTQNVNIGSRMAYTPAELCVGCHSEKSPRVARANDLWLHPPVAKGWCTECHSPHKSQRQYMLLKSNNELCNQCHVSSDLQFTPEHQQDPEADCLSCHNPHMGHGTNLLKTEYDERSQRS